VHTVTVGTPLLDTVHMRLEGRQPGRAQPPLPGRLNISHTSVYRALEGMGRSEMPNCSNSDLSVNRAEQGRMIGRLLLLMRDGDQGAINHDDASGAGAVVVGADAGASIAR
jgi:hypothetical protein